MEDHAEDSPTMLEIELYARPFMAFRGARGFYPRYSQIYRDRIDHIFAKLVLYAGWRQDDWFVHVSGYYCRPSTSLAGTDNQDGRL